MKYGDSLNISEVADGGQIDVMAQGVKLRFRSLISPSAWWGKIWERISDQEQLNESWKSEGVPKELMTYLGSGMFPRVVFSSLGSSRGGYDNADQPVKRHVNAIILSVSN